MPDRFLAASPVELQLRAEEDGLAVLEIRGRRAGGNPLGIQALRDLSVQLARVEQMAVEGSVRILLITTAAAHPPLTGYDLEELRRASSAEAIRWCREAHEILGGLESLSIPSIAAIQGEWLGGAAEIALACTYRVASDTPHFGIGFPQTRFGLLPAWRGTVALPRLLGFEGSLDLILTGRSLTARQARRAGLIDRILPSEDFMLRLARFAARRLKRGTSRRRIPRPLRRLFLESAQGRRLVIALAGQRHVRGSAPGPALQRALDLLASNVSLPLEEALEEEVRAVGQLIGSADTRGRLHANHFIERARRRLPPGPDNVEAAAILGAGQTGSDLAHLLASAGVPVRIKAPRPAVVREAVARTRGRLEWEREQGLISPQQARARSGLITGASGFGGFGTLDLVIAAPDDETHASVDLLRGVESHVDEDCLLAFHDWTASPTVVQRELRHPERVLGIAPSFPVERFPLVEIVPGAATSSDSVFAAHRWVRGLGRTGVVVSEQTPTPATRLLGILLAEGARLLDEGATVLQIDQAAATIGLEVGPIHRIDAIGSVRANRMLEALALALGERMTPGATLQRVAGEAGTLYRYRSGKPAGPHPSLPRGIWTDGEAVMRMIRQRLLLLLINEAALLLEDGCVTDPGDLEVISILGLGYSNRRGGLLFQADEIGPGRVVQQLSDHIELHGERFRPASLLLRLNQQSRGFFDPWEAKDLEK